jgi:hypothetical protein
MKNKAFIQTSLILLLFSSLAFVSCKNNLAIFSENEKKGLTEICQFLGGNITCGKHWGNSTIEGKTSVFTVTLKNSKGAEAIANTKMVNRPAQMIASNMALILYKNLTTEERSKYTAIQAAINFADGKTNTFQYSINELEFASTKIKLVDKIVNLLKTKNYDGLNAYFVEKSPFSKLNKKERIAFVKSIEVRHPSTEDFEMWGFGQNAEVITFMGNLIRGGEPHRFTIMLNPDLGKEEVYYMNYDY